MASQHESAINITRACIQVTIPAQFVAESLFSVTKLATKPNHQSLNMLSPPSQSLQNVAPIHHVPLQYKPREALVKSKSVS